MPPPRLLLVFVLTLSVATAACGRATAEIDLGEMEPARPASARAPAGSGTLHIAVAPILSPRHTSPLYRNLAGYLSERLQRPVELMQGKTYSEINDLVRTGTVAMAFICTYPYVVGHDEFGMELLAVPEKDGQTTSYSLLIAARDSAATSIDDLRGVRFAFMDPLSNTGRLVPMYQLVLRGQNPHAFFGQTIFTYSHDRSIRAVAEGVVDAASVDGAAFEYLAARDPDIVARVRVVERWGPFGSHPVVINPRLDPALKSQLQQVLLDMQSNSEGLSILQELMIDRFAEPDDAAYDSVRGMREYLRSRDLAP